MSFDSIGLSFFNLSGEKYEKKCEYGDRGRGERKSKKKHSDKFYKGIAPGNRVEEVHRCNSMWDKDVRHSGNTYKVSKQS